MARNFQEKPSDIVGIENKIAAFEFNRTCSMRLQIYDNERSVENIKAISTMTAIKTAVAVGQSFGGKEIDVSKVDKE